MKVCSKCSEQKAEELFSMKNGKRSSVCKLCHSAYYKEYWKRQGTYDKHKTRIKKNNARYVERNRRLVLDRLSGGCVDCGMLDVRVLEFDHLPQFEKSFTISRKLASVSESTLTSEMDKCEVVCANCHRIRTYGRNPSYKQLAWIG